MSKEPVGISAAIAAIIVALLARYDIDWIGSEAIEALLQVAAVLVGGWVARRQVFSKNTIREAGLDPAVVEQRAADPMVPKKA